MNKQQQAHWPAQAVTMLFTVTQIPMVRHLAHPVTGQPLCGAQGTWEQWETLVNEFEPAAWRGCKDCGSVLGWLVEEGGEIPSCLVAMRQMLGEPTFGPQALTDHLLQHGGQATYEVLPLLVEYAPVSVWQDRLQVSERGEHGTLIEAGIAGHIFPPGEPVVLVTTGGDGATLHMALIKVEAVKQAQAVGRLLSCVITRNLSPYWDRALFHLQRF